MRKSPTHSQTASRIHSAALHLLRRVRRDDPLMELSPARASALSILVFGGPKTPGELTRIEQVAAPTMTKLINGLVRDGYVLKKRSAEDGRAVVIRATAKAERVLREGRRRRVRLVHSLFKDLTSAEWALLARAAQLIEEAAK